jgi:Ca2+-binding EF-hand superfamily protein
MFFRRFDDNGTGFITVDEFIVGFKEMAKSNASVVDRIAQLVGQECKEDM